MEAGWEHVEGGVSRDHGTKEGERREKDLRRYHDQGGEEGASERERRREEAGGVEEGENGEDEEGIGE